MLDNLEKNWEWTKFQTLSLRFDGWNVGRDGVTLYKEEGKKVITCRVIVGYF